MNNNTFSDFCNGCGLCHSVYNYEMETKENGIISPIFVNDKHCLELNELCMSSGFFWKNSNSCSLWGPNIIPPFYAYSNDSFLRKKASSGGVLSEIAIYLLKTGKVDGIIQIKASESSQIKTDVVVSYTEKDVLSCVGSRYTASAPLFNIYNLIDDEKKYAFIGKPCDVQALRNQQSKDEKLRISIPYLLSFLCAGVPSYQAEQKLLNKLNTNEKECINLVYRGNGWPGYTIAYNKNNNETGKMTYNESWGNILGRDVLLSCRFCFDGIGEAADISCGDGWYIKDNKPDFSENNGRNIVFIRSNKGLDLINELIKSGIISCEYSNSIYEELKVIQNYQYTRRITMRDRITALKLFGRSYPNYNKTILKKIGKEASFSLRLRIFLGTLKRLYKNRI